MAIAPEQIGIGIGRYFTRPGTHPYDMVEWERREARIHELQGRHRRLLPARRRVPRLVVAELHEHRRPEVLPRHPRHRRARDVAAPGHRPHRRHDHRVGHARRLLRRRARGRRVPQRAQVHPPHPARRLQLAGLVQHRREGRARAGLRVLHPRGRGHDGRDPQLVPRGRNDLQGRLGLGDQPVGDPVVARAPQGRRHRERPGQLHARRRRVRRHDQVGRQDPARREDGHPQRRPSRHRRVHLVQGDRGAQGARAARRRVRHGPRRQGQPLDPVPEREQLGARHRRVHAGGARGPRLGPQGRHHRRDRRDREGARPDAPDLGGHVGVRRPGHAVRHHDQPLAHRAQHRPHQRQQPVQ